MKQETRRIKSLTGTQPMLIVSTTDGSQHSTICQCYLILDHSHILLEPVNLCSALYKVVAAHHVFGCKYDVNAASIYELFDLLIKPKVLSRAGAAVKCFYLGYVSHVENRNND